MLSLPKIGAAAGPCLILATTLAVCDTALATELRGSHSLPAADAKEALRSTIAPDTEVLSSAVDEAVRVSYLIEASRAAHRAAELESLRTSLSWLPKARVTVDRQWSVDRYRSTRALIGDRVEDTLNVSVSMPLFNFGRTAFSIAGARAEARAARADIVQTQLQVEQETAQAYLAVVRARKAEAILARSQDALRKIRSAVVKRHQAGDGTLTDIALADADLAAFGDERESARNQRLNAESAFRSLTQREPGRFDKEPRKLKRLPRTLATAKSLAHENNPAIAAAEFRSDGQRSRARATYGEFLPKLDLVADYERDWIDDDINSSNDDWRLGVRLSVPLVNPEAVPAVLRSRAQAKQREFQSLDVKRQIDRSVETVWNTRETASRRLMAINRQVDALRRAETGIMREYEAGLRPIDDVLEVRVRVARAELTQVQAQFDYQFEGYRLLALIGGSVLEDIGGTS